MIKFNINNYIDIKLTDIGRDELKRQHLAFFGDRVPYESPNEDSEGYSRWQLWDIMNKLGNLLGNGFEPPFMPIIKIEIKDEIQYKSCPNCGNKTKHKICNHCFHEVI